MQAAEYHTLVLFLNRGERAVSNRSEKPDSGPADGDPSQLRGAASARCSRRLTHFSARVLILFGQEKGPRLLLSRKGKHVGLLRRWQAVTGTTTGVSSWVCRWPRVLRPPRPGSPLGAVTFRRREPAGPGARKFSAGTGARDSRDVTSRANSGFF